MFSRALYVLAVMAMVLTAGCIAHGGYGWITGALCASSFASWIGGLWCAWDDAHRRFVDPALLEHIVDR